MFTQARQAAFSTYDPRVDAGINKFDPRMTNGYNGADEGSNVQTAFPGQKMQINLILTNNAASTLTFEMFNWLTSFIKVRNLAYTGVANYLYIPQDSYEGIQAIISDTDGTVGWTQTGDLAIRGLPANPIATIGCTEAAYRSLFEASGITPFLVSYFRMTVATDAQISKTITWFQKTMAGGESVNKINPRSYFRPNQFQDLTLDVTVSFTIGIDSGLRMDVLNGQTVQLALFIEAWTNQTIGQ